MLIIMLLFSSFLLENVSHACDPANIEPTGITPADQAIDVPVDSMIRGELSQGVGGWENFALRVTSNDESVSGEHYGFCAETVGWDSLCYLTFLPNEDLSPLSTYLVEVKSAFTDSDETLLSASFTTGEGLTEATSELPSLTINEVTYHPYDEACDIEAEYRFEMNVMDAPNDPHELSFLYLYQDGDPQVLRNVVHVTNDVMDVHADLPEGSNGEGCFIALAVDGAGCENTISAPVCQGDTPSDEGGAVGGCSCSNATGPAVGWATLLLAALVGLRRRKSHLAEA